MAVDGEKLGNAEVLDAGVVDVERGGLVTGADEGGMHSGVKRGSLSPAFGTCLFVALTLASSLNTFAQQPAQAAPPAIHTNLASLPQTLAQSPLPGGCVARTRGAAVEVQQPFGYANVTQRQPYTVDTWQPIGSVSKTVIGLALVTAADQGLVQLDAPVSPLVGFAVGNPARRSTDKAAPITLRQLAQHTSGIVDSEAGYQVAAYEKGRTDPQRPRRALGDYLAAYLRPGGRLYQRAHFADAAPGTRFNYSNVGSALAAYALERASGQPFDRYATATVLAPLGLFESAWFMPAERRAQAATLYTAERQPVPPYLLATYPDGGLRSTCGDLTRLLLAWNAALDGNAPAPLSAAALPVLKALRDAMAPQFTPGHAPPGLPAREPNQGLFFAIRKDGSVGHTGSDDGVSVFLFLDPATRVGRLLMTNIDISADPALPPVAAAIWQALAE